MKNILLKKLEDGIQRPLWSVMIPTHNNAHILAQTLASVMQQALPQEQMEIVVVDDCSTEDIEKVVKSIGRERVSFFRQSKNVGHTANFKTCLQLSKGKYIHLLHGDDLVYPGFYQSFSNLFIQYPQLMAAFCRCNFINEQNEITNTSTAYQQHSGPFNNFFPQICNGQMLQTPSIVVQRTVYETIGIFSERLSWCEDWEMWARIGKHFSVGFVNEVLAGYRIHTSSNSGKYILSGENIKDLKRAVHIISGYAPGKAERKKAKMISGAYYANYAMEMADHLLALGQKRGARNQLRHAILLSDSIRMNIKVIKKYCSTFFK
ncbi:MAG: glycosyltransferase [Bacteroidetes bacterium]|nr:glycosyltransferase [Bacteroidota bacterium]